MKLKEEIYVKVDFVGEIKLLNYIINHCDDNLSIIINDTKRIEISKELLLSKDTISRYLTHLVELEILERRIRGLYTLNIKCLNE